MKEPKHAKVVTHEERTDSAYLKLKTDLSVLKGEIKEHRNEIISNREKFFTGIAFISFNKMSHADQVTSKYKMSTLAWIFHGCKYKLRYKIPNSQDSQILRIDPAPEPAEIQWQNLKYPFRHQVKQKLLNILIAAVILSMSLGIIFGLKYAAYKIKKNFQKIETVSKGDGSTYQKAKPLDTGEDALLQFISIMIFTVSKIVNKIFDKVLAKLAVWEKPYTNSSLYWSTMSKTVISQFLNASCLIVIVHYVLKGAERYIIWGSGSLLVDIWYLIIFYSMVNPGLYILNFGFFVNQCKKCKLKKYKDSKRYTQLQAHKISEGVPMDAVRCYTDIYQIFLTALFFVPAFPIGAAFMIGALIVIYWTNKFYLLRVYCRPKYLQSNLAFESLVFIKVGAFVLSMGELYFDIVLRGASNASIILIVQAVVTGLLIPVPIEDMFLDFYTYSGDEAEIKADVTYEKCKKTLDLDYLRANPVTSGHALLSHIELLNNVNRSKKRGSFAPQLKIPANPTEERSADHSMAKALFGSKSRPSLLEDGKDWDLEDKKKLVKYTELDNSPVKKLSHKESNQDDDDDEGVKVKKNQISVAKQSTLGKKVPKMQKLDLSKPV